MNRCSAVWRPGLMVVQLALVAGGAQAMEFRAAVGGTVEHTDNATKSTTDERSELESTAWLTLGVEHEGPQWVADLGYRLQRTFYRRDTQTDRTSIEGEGLLRWEAIPQRGFLEITHSRRNILQDRALANIRDNREDRDITRVTPSYRFRLGPVDTLTASVSWTGVNYQRRGELDSDRYGAQLLWTRQLSPVASLFFDASTSEVRFDASGPNDYRYDSATVGYSATLNRISYTVRAGVNRADRSGGDRDVTGGLFEVTARYRSGLQTWQLDLGHRLTDSSIGDGNQMLADFDSGRGSLDRIDVIERSSAQLGWTTQGVCQRCTLRVAAFYEREDYEQTPDDSDEWGINTGLSYRLTRVSDISLGYRYRDISFRGDNPRSDYDVQVFSLGYDHRFGQRLRVGVFVADERRSGGGNFDELRGGLSVSYEIL